MADKKKDNEIIADRRLYTDPNGKACEADDENRVFMIADTGDVLTPEQADRYAQADKAKAHKDKTDAAEKKPQSEPSKGNADKPQENEESK